MTKLQWFILGCMRILTYAVFGLSIFDIYYTSPIVHGMTPHKSPIPPAAKRLVLVSFDGLRANSMFEIHSGNKSNFPFVRHIIETTGAWGVVTNDGPTESRPSHIAMTAGVHEDPAAVRHRWVKNPVMVDSLFNESRKTWAMGNKHVLNHFQNVVTYRYTGDSIPDLRQFFKHTQNFLKGSQTKKDLDSLLKKDQVVLFLHLDITDELGHEYLGSLTNTTAIGIFRNKLLDVDKSLEQVVTMVTQFYNDTATAFVVTGDHGIAAHAWHLSHLMRHDMDQIDMAPLLASLIGVNFPMNSEGRFPHEYLNVTSEERAEMVYAHTRQVLALLEVRMKGNNSQLLSNIFFLLNRDPVLHRLDQFHNRIRYLLSVKEFPEAISECIAVSDAAVQWLRANHLSAERILLRLSMAAGSIGWMAYILTFLAGDDNTHIVSDTGTTRLSCCKRYLYSCCSHRKCILFMLVAFIVLLIGLRELSCPWHQCVYIMVTPFLWSLVYLRKNSLLRLLASIRLVPNRGAAIIAAIIWLCLIQLTVYSVLSRKVLTAGFIVLAISAFTNYPRTPNKKATVAWSVLCLILAVFPQVPIPKYPDEANQQVLLITGSSVCLTTFLFLLGTTFRKIYPSSKRNIIICVIQIVILAISTHIAVHPVTKSAESATRVLSWTILGISPLWPLLVTTDVGTRLRTIFLSFISPFMLLSKSWDILYITCVCLLLFIWCRLEESSYGILSSAAHNKILQNGGANGGANGRLSVEDNSHRQTRNASRVVAVIFILFAAFFGRESIASSVMFYRIPFVCVIPKSQSLTGSILLGIKNIIPVIYTLCVLEAIHKKVEFSWRQFILLTIFIGDVMSLQMLYQFHETGTWYELSTVSILQYAVPTGCVLLLLLLLPLVRVMMAVQVKPILLVLWIAVCSRNTAVKLCTLKNVQCILHRTATAIIRIITCPVYARICLIRMFNSQLIRSLRSRLLHH